MARSAPAVAALLLLVIISGRIGAAACELACLDAADVPRAAQTTSAAIQPPSGCHESTPVPVEDAAGVDGRSAHTGCGHEEAAVPSVVAVKVVRGVDTPRTDHAPSAEPRHSSLMTAAHFSSEGAPPGASAVRVIPLRI